MHIDFNNPVAYYPATGKVARANPVPARAVEARDEASPHDALAMAGLEPVDYELVLSVSPAQISAFKRHYGLGKFLTSNAKTNKPRPTGRDGIIYGLAIAPHFYPSFLNRVDLTEDGELEFVDLRAFFEFNGRDIRTASIGSGLPKDELLSVCHGSSPYCRQTCLVATGQHTTGKHNAYSKMIKTYALLAEPEMFVAALRHELLLFHKNADSKGKDAVVRLNMLSDIPWYSLCPELLEELEGLVYFYDYTKLSFWNSPDYQRVEHLLDLTYSFSGTNTSKCREALQAGHRIAVAFASENLERRATAGRRTTFGEMQLAGLIRSDGTFADIGFGDGYIAVDGDESDYRMDDPEDAIVALNFKEASTKRKGGDLAPHMAEATLESRQRFAKQVKETDAGLKYGEALRSRSFGPSGKTARKAYFKTTRPEDIVADYEEFRRPRKNPLEVIDDEMPPIDRRTHLTMFPITGTDFLVGPHVPTVLED